MVTNWTLTCSTAGTGSALLLVQTRQEHENNHSMADIEAPEDVNTSPAPELKLDKVQVKL